MNIELNVLKDTINTIFDEMKADGIESIKLDFDFYWNVPAESLYDIYNDPQQLDIGQLEDDYRTLCEAKEKDILVRYNLKNISAILRYLAEKDSE